MRFRLNDPPGQLLGHVLWDGVSYCCNTICLRLIFVSLSVPSVEYVAVEIQTFFFDFLMAYNGSFRMRAEFGNEIPCLACHLPPEKIYAHTILARSPSNPGQNLFAF